MSSSINTAIEIILTAVLILNSLHLHQVKSETTYVIWADRNFN